MKRTAVVEFIVLSTCGLYIAHGAVKGFYNMTWEGRDSELNVFSNTAECASSGITPDICEKVFAAASVRANATSDLYAYESDCEKRHGKKKCVPADLEENPNNRTLYRPEPVGVAILTSLIDPKNVTDAEPVYSCPDHYYRCRQTLIGTDFRGPLLKQKVSARNFAGEFRYADVERGTNLLRLTADVAEGVDNIRDARRTASVSNDTKSRTPTTVNQKNASPPVSKEQSRIVRSGSYSSIRLDYRGGLGSTARSGGIRFS